ncbi:hypothetical protein MY1884_000582 [Beauveria asiatica]
MCGRVRGEPPNSEAASESIDIGGQVVSKWQTDKSGDFGLPRTVILTFDAGRCLPGDFADPGLRGDWSPAEINSTISDDTACTHASNILGTVTDVRAITDLAHGVGAIVCVDGVAFAPHRPVDVRALGVDFYVFSWYKVYGPHVIKVLKQILPLSSERNK